MVTVCIGTLYSACALPSVAVLSSPFMYFPGTLFGYFLIDFGMVPVVIIFAIILVITCMQGIYNYIPVLCFLLGNSPGV